MVQRRRQGQVFGMINRDCIIYKGVLNFLQWPIFRLLCMGWLSKCKYCSSQPGQTNPSHPQQDLGPREGDNIYLKLI
jgi:hypothetical protein